MSLYSPIRYRQTQTRAALVPGTGFVYSVKAIEYMRDMFRWNSRTVIGDLDHDPPGAVKAHIYRYSPPNGRVFDGIVNDIHQGLPQKQTISLDGCAFISRQRQFQGLLFHQHFQQRGRFARQLQHGKDGRMERDGAVVGARNGQETIDQPRKTVSFLQHATDNVAILFTAAIFCSPTSPTRRMAVSGVRSSCEASDVKRLSCSKDCSSRARVLLKARASWPSSPSTFSVGRRSLNRSEVICSARLAICSSGASARRARA